ncbi:MAG: 6-phosphogluconolactonase, partial [Bacteroidota bacterium]
PYIIGQVIKRSGVNPNRKKKMELKVYKDKATVAAKFSEFLVTEINEHEGRFNIALSGGSTPKIVFDYLATHFPDQDWSSVHLYWGDERCVPPTDDQSNYKMTVEHLLSKINIPSENVHRILGETDPQEAARHYATELKNHLPMVDNSPQFDMVMLGMGGDGHTASIFPHEIHLWSSKDICVVATHPESGQKRVSLTGEVINQAKSVVFLVTGADKNTMVAQVHKRDEHSAQFPAALVQPKSKNLIWFLDQDAKATESKTD